jgi:hypothetical protein
MKKILFVMVCVGLLVGCKSSVVTPDGTEVSYRKGEGVLRAVLGGSMPEVTNATIATLEDLELVGIDSTVDKLKGRITARMAVGTRVTINLTSVGTDSTSIRIKVGRLGDRSISMQILRNIERRIKGNQE